MRRESGSLRSNIYLSSSIENMAGILIGERHTNAKVKLPDMKSHCALNFRRYQ